MYSTLDRAGIYSPPLSQGGQLGLSTHQVILKDELQFIIKVSLQHLPKIDIVLD